MFRIQCRLGKVWNHKLIALVVVLLLGGCDLVDVVEVPGCTDSRARNRDSSATEDDGSCFYSSVVFYVTNLEAIGARLNLDGQLLGTMTRPYLRGPGNCTALGTVNLEFQDGRSHEWEAVLDSLSDTGVVFASPSLDCVQVPVFD